MFKRFFISLSILVTSTLYIQAQKADLRGFVINKENGSAVEGAIVQIPKLDIKVITDQNGFYACGKVETGNYKVIIYFPGYD
ncbi:MAG: carboxypeptidase regulatory-like domain-containing protein, partial [Bacteroidetes bacterium]|nr:carboxypeptidase regulatory-like domain-containing protein [Bacteroidota bacterium]